MPISQTPFLTELTAGHSGPPIPAAKRAYFQQRLRIRIFNVLLEKYVQAQKIGLNKNILARRIGKTPDVINRWLGSPSNLTIDTISDLLLGIAAEELELSTSSPLHQVANNYSNYEDSPSANAPHSDLTLRDNGHLSTRASVLDASKQRSQLDDDLQKIGSSAESTAYAQPRSAEEGIR
jgi:hypothetical protein